MSYYVVVVHPDGQVQERRCDNWREAIRLENSCMAIWPDASVEIEKREIG